MSVPEILTSIGERFESSATAKNVYGEPVVAGDRTVIPVARIAYGFGGGGGRGSEPSDFGGGGGGHVRAIPVGVVEISLAGTRFIPFADWRRWVAALAITFAVGLAVGSRRRHQ